MLLKFTALQYTIDTYANNVNRKDCHILIMQCMSRTDIMREVIFFHRWSIYKITLDCWTKHLTNNEIRHQFHCLLFAQHFKLTKHLKN